ncbi:hypothetical protein ACYSNO_08485 [Enterococcus sp. LJL98]
MVRVVRWFLYGITTIFILLSVFGTINERYQFISLIGGILCLVILMFMVAFEKNE